MHDSGYEQLSIIQNVGNQTINLTLQDVIKALNDGHLLKPEDSLLHSKLFRCGDSIALDGKQRRALFYPTAGRDILFPLIVGLPYCTDFYFFEKYTRISLRIPMVLKAIGRTAIRVDSGYPDRQCHEFEIDSIARRIWTMRMDNRAFLDLDDDIPLAFFFHRGDSDGEGGSGQRWDSDLFPLVLKKATSDVGLRIFTDGEPGGLRESVMSHLDHIRLQDRVYFYGVLRGTSLNTVSSSLSITPSPTNH